MTETETPERPTKAIVDFKPIVQQAQELNPDLILEGIDTKVVIDLSPIVDYTDERVDAVAGASRITEKLKEVQKPTSLAEIGKLEGEEKKAALRRLILVDGADYTTIRISKILHEKLMRRGQKGESFDDIVAKVVKEVESDKNATS